VSQLLSIIRKSISLGFVWSESRISTWIALKDAREISDAAEKDFGMKIQLSRYTTI
jgi:hypothetical protein